MDGLRTLLHYGFGGQRKNKMDLPGWSPEQVAE